jgi:hypothetical protein
MAVQLKDARECQVRNWKIVPDPPHPTFPVDGWCRNQRGWLAEAYRSDVTRSFSQPASKRSATRRPSSLRCLPILGCYSRLRTPQAYPCRQRQQLRTRYPGVTGIRSNVMQSFLTGGCVDLESWHGWTPCFSCHCLQSVLWRPVSHPTSLRALFQGLPPSLFIERIHHDTQGT